MVGGSLFRLAYAAGLLVAPDAMARAGLAADARGDGYARMTTRAFGGVHVNVALLTLRAAATGRDTRLALALNLGCDTGDLVATLLEARTGDLARDLAVGGTALQSTGIAVWGSLLRHASR